MGRVICIFLKNNLFNRITYLNRIGFVAVRMKTVETSVLAWS